MRARSLHSCTLSLPGAVLHCSAGIAPQVSASLGSDLRSYDAPHSFCRDHCERPSRHLTACMVAPLTGAVLVRAPTRSLTAALPSRSTLILGGARGHSLTANTGPIWASGQTDIRQTVGTTSHGVPPLPFLWKNTPARPDQKKRDGGVWRSRSSVGEGLPV